MDLFAENANLIDLPLSGRDFTWINKRDDPIFSRLDRFLVSDYRETRFPLTSQLPLFSVYSNHVPLILDSGETKSSLDFRFEKMWAFEPDFDKLIETWWQSFEEEDNPTLNLTNKL